MRAMRCTWLRSSVYLREIQVTTVCDLCFRASTVRANNNREPALRSARSPQSLTNSSPNSTGAGSHGDDSATPSLIRHAQDYGYSNSDPLTSMGMLNKVC
jgi:hypothetical protein